MYKVGSSNYKDVKMTKEALEYLKNESQNGTIEELYFDDMKIEAISKEFKKELELSKELLCLSMNNCGLSSLTDFPTMAQLIRLEIMENKFPVADLEHIAHLSELQSLSLGSNDIKTVEDLTPLAKLEHLIQLDLSETDLSKTADYRKDVFVKLPNLQILDNLDQSGNEYNYESEDDSEGGMGEFGDSDEDEEDSEGEDMEEDEEDDGDIDDDEESEEDDDDEEQGNPLNAKRLK